MQFQNTLARAVKCSGIGVHSGINIDLEIRPASDDAGISFVRSDMHENNVIPALFDRVVDTSMCTKIANEHGASVATIEHVMSALWGCGVDNATIYVNASEVPVMDGSSDFFVNMIQETGLVEQATPRRFIEISKLVSIQTGNKTISIEPSDSFSVDFAIDFDDQCIGEQIYSFREEEDFANQIGKARTFGFVHELDYLRSKGLALGASLENAIAIDSGNILNKGGLRYSDEFVRHKILDCIGDLYLAGARIKGKVKAVKSGHAMNNMLLRKVFATDSIVHLH